MKQIGLEPVIRLHEILQSFAHIIRVAHIKGRETRENDVEHSFIITMLAWHIVDVFKLPLDKDKVIKYALVHDLVEVYAGDTYILDEEAIKTKHEREERARLQIKEELPEFSDLNDYILAYETQVDSEARFVKALDKVQPVLANYLEKGRTWKEMDVSFTDLVTHKREKTALDAEIAALLEEIIAQIEPKKLDYFPKE